MNEGCGQPTSLSQVRKQMEHLEKGSTTLQGLASQLKDRLTPILRQVPTPENKKPEGSPSPLNVPIAQELESDNNRLASVIETLRDILDRLEL
jgi:hypothetical protein